MSKLFPTSCISINKGICWHFFRSHSFLYTSGAFLLSTSTFFTMWMKAF
jgi:hypothetical protein